LHLAHPRSPSPDGQAFTRLPVCDRRPGYGAAAAIQEKIVSPGTARQKIGTSPAVKNIIPRKIAENAQTAQYTASGCRTIIDKFTVTNFSGASAQFSANLIANGGSAGNSNLVLKTRTIQPNETYLCPELIGQVLEDGGFISTLAGTASALTISASGREVT
jgi:hypothetical protein